MRAPNCPRVLSSIVLLLLPIHAGGSSAPPISEVIADAVFAEWPSERLRLFTTVFVESFIRNSEHGLAVEPSKRCVAHLEYPGESAWRQAVQAKHPESLAERFDFSLIYPTREGRVMLSDEKSLIEALVAMSVASPIEARMKALRNVMADLRTNEVKYEATEPRARKTRDMESIEAGAPKLQTLDSFAYGSTPYFSWLQVWQHQALRNAMKATQDSGRAAVVLGSSLGWTVHYIYLTFGIRTVGYEILPHRAQLARRVQERHQLDATSEGSSAAARVEFIQGDALGADLSDAGIISLADLSWPEPLADRIWSKIAQEAKKDVVIVSNAMPSNATWNHFRLLGSVTLPVSWTPDQPFLLMALAPGHAYATREFPPDHGAIETQTKPRVDTKITSRALEATLGLLWERAGVVRLAIELEGSEWKKPIPPKEILRRQAAKLRQAVRLALRPA